MDSLPKLSERRQGDVVPLNTVLLLTGTESYDRLKLDPPIGVVLTQTCDLVRPTQSENDPRPFVIVAPLQKASPELYQQVEKRRKPAYVVVPWAGENLIANLELSQTLDKDFLVKECMVISSPQSEDQARSFADAIARKFGRAALPDEANLSLAKAKDRIKDKTGRKSPEGRVLDEMVDRIRVEPDPHWEAKSLEITIVFLVPTLPATSEKPARSVRERLDGLPGAADRIRLAAELLLADSKSNAGTTLYLWDEFARAFAQLCEPRPPVVAIKGETIATNSYTYDRFLYSDDLDLDYLSSGNA